MNWLLRRRNRRVRTPTVLQMEAVECGAASLAMVLGYFGRHVPLGELRQACGISRDGAKASSLLKVADQHGLAGKGFRRLAHRVLDGPFPAIALWEGGHYVVLEGARGGFVHLNDPQTGPRRVTRDEFEGSYSGIVLTFERTEAFAPGGSPPELLKRLLTLVTGYRKPLAFVAFLGVLLAYVTIVLPGLVATFVNGVLVGGLTDWLAPLALAAAGVAVLQAAITGLKQSTFLNLEIGMGLQRSADLVWHLLRLPTAFFDHRYLGAVVFRATSVDRVVQLLTRDLGGATLNALTAAIMLLMMSLIDPVLAGISLGGLLINVAALRLLYRARADAAIRLRHEQARLFSTSMIGIAVIETLKATGAEDDFFAKWASHHAQAVNSEQRVARFEQASLILPAFAAMLTNAAIFIVGGLRVMDGTLTVGALLGAQALFILISAPVQQIVEVAGRAQETAADLARLDDVFDSPVDWRHDPPVPGVETAPVGMGLRLDHVTFGYNPLEAPLIDDLSIDVAPGRWLALVGDSGSGKSTIGKLISGLYVPWQGRVLLDGRPLTSIDRRTLASRLAWVPQEISLFAGTINDNLSLWDSTIGREAVAAAARDAQVLDAIAAMPDTFAAAVEEGGRNLSGGEQQRIEIARALARTPSILVLDEATSAVDPTTELDIMTALRRRGITCIVIAHRLSSIRDCDEIIVLEHGRIAERGSHQELVAMQGAYARLIAEGTAA